jgi:hypothetical protein
MEASVEVIEAEKLVPLFDIPAEMLNDRVQVIVVPLPKERDAGSEAEKKPKINMEIFKKFRERAESGEFKKHLKNKLAEGVTFEFDAQKIIDDAMTESDWQKLYALEKRR